jgi:hypothetical protein
MELSCNLCTQNLSLVHSGTNLLEKNVHPYLFDFVGLQLSLNLEAL